MKKFLKKLADLLAKFLGHNSSDAPPHDPGQTPTPTPTPGDAVPFASLQWAFGGFDGSKATLSTPRLSNASCNGKVLYYKWDVGLAGWGLSHGDAGAVCAAFIERNGQWIGGKFDWVSTSRASRELKHMESYNNWPSSGIKLPIRGKVAFVVIS